MTAIRARAGKAYKKSYKQMHLLNDLIYGPGELWNLTPGTAQSNKSMESEVEDPLKRAVMGKGLVVNFEAEVHYNNDPTLATNTEISQNPNKYRMQRISFKAEQLEYDEGNKQWEKATIQDSDVAAVDGASIYWNRGSLPPLNTKPRIIDTATTVQDLEDADIPTAVANRIHAWVQATNPGKFTGQNKKAQLAELVENYDNAGPLDTSGWNATSVLWT